MIWNPFKSRRKNREENKSNIGGIVVHAATGISVERPDACPNCGSDDLYLCSHAHGLTSWMPEGWNCHTCGIIFCRWCRNNPDDWEGQAYRRDKKGNEEEEKR